MATAAPYGLSLDIFDPYARATSDPQKILLQAAWARLNTPEGTFWNAPGYGLLASDELNDEQDNVDAIASRVKAQLEQDERVDTAIVTPEIEEGDGSDVAVRLGIELHPADPAVDTFRFTFRLTADGVDVLTEGSA